jgi:hypothetical protein
MKVMSIASLRMILSWGLWKASGGTSMSAARSPSEIGSPGRIGGNAQDVHGRGLDPA